MSVVDEIGMQLSVLASRAAQIRYMVNATKDEYLLLAEALDHDVPLDELVLQNHAWNTLHVAAERCLSDIGFDLAQWERDEGCAE